MKSNADSITFENSTDILEVISVLEYFIKENSRYEEDENLATFWEDDIAYEMRPRLKTARRLLQMLIEMYNEF